MVEEEAGSHTVKVPLRVGKGEGKTLVERHGHLRSTDFTPGDFQHSTVPVNTQNLCVWALAFHGNGQGARAAREIKHPIAALNSGLLNKSGLKCPLAGGEAHHDIVGGRKKVET